MCTIHVVIKNHMNGSNSQSLDHLKECYKIKFQKQELKMVLASPYPK